MKIKIGLSNRHVHLTNEDVEILFGKGYKLTPRNYLYQSGQFATEETVTLKTNKNIKEHVRIVGPTRSYTQVEVLEEDKEYFGINPPVRNSKDLENSESMTIIGPNGEITKENICIIANRHIHISEALAKEWGVADDEPVGVIIDGEKKGIIEAFFKTSKDGYLEIHLDTDDANGFMLKQNDTVEIKFQRKD